MGNAQSAFEHPHNNKLVKPRTNTNAAALVPSATSQSSLSSKYAYLSASERQQIKSQLLSPLETEFENSSSEEDSKRAELAANVQWRPSTATRTNSSSGFGSTRNSNPKLQSLPGSKVSLVPSSQAVDLETVIKMLEEVKQNASPEELLALTQALQTHQPCPLPCPTPAANEGLDRRPSFLTRSTSSLFRRRSIMSTPKRAPREPGAEINRRTWNSWRAPQVDSEEEAKWRAGMIGTPALPEMAALDLAEERTSSTPRVLTPGDMEYTHLGSLGLGSLRIANGPPSPAASTKFNQQNSNSYLTQEENYFTALDTSDNLMMKPTKRRGHERSKSAVAPTSPPLYRKLGLSTAGRRAKTTSRIDSPVKTEALSNAGASSPQLYDDLEPEPLRRLRVMNKSADTLATITSMAKEYQAEAAGFQPSHPEEGTFHREEPLRIFHGAIFCEPLTAIDSAPLETPLSGVAQFHDRTPSLAGPGKAMSKNQIPENRRPLVTKADSGYASEGSFMTVQHKALRESSPTPSKISSMAVNMGPTGIGSNKNDQRSVHAQRPGTRPMAFGQRDAITLGRDDYSHVKTSAGADPDSVPLQVQRTLDCSSLCRESSSSLSASEIASSETPRRPVSLVSKFATDSKASSSKRLQKRRPSYQELPLVQTCDPILERTIPGIPVDVRSQFTRRVSESPAMECLLRAYPSQDRADAKKRKTESVDAVALKSPSPSETPEKSSRNNKHSSTEPPQKPSARSLRRGFSFFGSMSKTRKEKEVVHNNATQVPAPAVVDLGTVATAPKDSPYDVAIPKPKWTATAPKHLRQIGNGMPRAKSIVGMDAQTATDFARARSKDRASLRPELSQRPKSYHDLYLEAGEGSVHRRRSRSSYGGDVPPIPTLQRREPSAAPASAPKAPDEPQTSVSTQSVPYIRARPTGRGRVVSEIITKYDQYGRTRPSKDEWEAYARLQTERRKSGAENLHEQPQSLRQRSNFLQEISPPPPQSTTTDRQHGSHHGYGAPVRQLHSYANRKSATYSDHYSADLFNVPFLP